MQVQRLAFVISALSVAVLTAGCSVNETVIPAKPVPPSAATADPAFAVSGTYKGSLVETQSSESRSGTVVIVIKETGRKISGTFDLTFQGQTSDLTLSGSVKAQKKTKARLAFEIDNAKGRYASATAVVGKKGLKGKATVPAESGKPEVHITFKTKRTADAGGRRNIVPQRSTV